MPSVKSICIADFYTGVVYQGDNYLDEDVNHGKESEVKVWFDKDKYSYAGWLQFDLHDIPIDVSKKKNVRYKLFIKQKSAEFSLDWYTGFWTGLDNAENYATYNKKPNTSGIINRATIKWVKNGEWIWCYLDEYLSERYILAPYISIEFDETNRGIFYSKESGTANAPHILIEYEEIVPENPIIFFPENITCRNDTEIIFNWQHQADQGYGQTKYDLQWRKAGEDNWKTITKSTSENQHTFSAGTFPTGTIQWRVRTYNEMGNVSGYSTASFISVGKSNAPKITGIKNDAFTVINWEANEEQDLFEIELYKNGQQIYGSGVQIGHGIYTFCPDVMLSDGAYNLKIRMTNIYGEQTEWTNYQFAISTEKPERPEAFISVEDDFIIRAKITDMKSGNRYFAARKNLETEEIEILGETLDGIYKDRTAASGVPYAYAVRAYNGGFSDSKEKVLSVKFDGVVIYNMSNDQMLHLHLSEEEYMNVQMRPGKEIVYTRCIGRPYPVTEETEWVDDEMSIKCFVTKNQWETLKKWFLKGDLMLVKTEKEVWYGDISSLGAANAFLNNGYVADIALKRTGAKK